MPFFQTLNYSSCNEDGLTELRALKLAPADHVCCITGSGDRVLHLLLGNPARVSAFDLNPAQNHLLELKMAVIGRSPNCGATCMRRSANRARPAC